MCILGVVDNCSGPYWGDLYDILIDEFTVDEIRLALKSLLSDGTLRQRECSEEHDWQYVRAKK